MGANFDNSLREGCLITLGYISIILIGIIILVWVIRAVGG